VDQAAIRRFRIVAVHRQHSDIQRMFEAGSSEAAGFLWLYHSEFHPSILVNDVITPYDSEHGLM
jgi:hypothetical protein